MSCRLVSSLLLFTFLRHGTLVQTTKLFVKERYDGPGSTLHSLLYAIGVASRYNISFGGVLTRASHISHKINITHLAARVLGLTNLAFVREMPPGTINVSTVAMLELMVARRAIKPDATYLLECHSLIKEGGLEGVKERRPNATLDEFLTPTLISTLRGHWAGLPSVERHGMTMAIHVRRGTRHKALTEDSHFLPLIDIFHQEAPSHARVHLYSLNDTREQYSFNVRRYLDKNINFHIDRTGHDEEDELLTIWAHFAQASVMVVDTSSFSWFPAFFNQNCVIYMPYHLHGMEDRMTLRHWIPSEDHDRIRGCIRKMRIRLSLTSSGLAGYGVASYGVRTRAHHFPSL